MCMSLYRNINREKIQFDFIKHTSQRGSFEDEIESLGGVVYEAPRFNGRNIIAYENWWKRFLKEHTEYSIIHIHFFTITAVIAPVVHKMGRRVIGHCHLHFYVNSVKSASQKLFIRLGGHCADYRFACSRTAGEFMYGKKEFVVVKNAIDISNFIFYPDSRRAARTELGISDDEIIVGTVGRFAPQKNIDGILEIITLLYSRDKRIRFLWVGEGELQSHAVSRVEELGLQKCVIFTGSRSDVNRMMQAMDIFILPSLWEGLGIVNIEAQAAGLPCFISDRVTKECNVTGRCVFLPINDAEKWADAILNADLTRYDAYEQIKDAGYDIVETSKWLEEYYLSINESA